MFGQDSYSQVLMEGSKTWKEGPQHPNEGSFAAACIVPISKDEFVVLYFFAIYQTRYSSYRRLDILLQAYITHSIRDINWHKLSIFKKKKIML